MLLPASQGQGNAVYDKRQAKNITKFIKKFQTVCKNATFS